MDINRLEELAKELQAAIDAGEVIDAYQAADGLGINHNNIFANAKKGKLRGVMVGHTWLTTPEAVADWRKSMPFHKK